MKIKRIIEIEEKDFEQICKVANDTKSMLGIVPLASSIIVQSKPYNDKGEWIPIKYRPLTVKERIAFAEHYGIKYCDTSEEKAFDCPLPTDKQEILISTPWGVVEDVADNDIDGEGFICYGLEGNGDWDGVEAWMPKPKRYTKEDADT